MTATAPFDCIAGRYDEVWTDTSIGRAQRDIVWRVVDRFFRQGDSVLDVGCGTGEDARRLADRGVKVMGIDASGEMVRRARARGVTAKQLPLEELDSLTGIFDGILSNFGALNCAADLGVVARSAARRLRPGGYAIVCLLNRLCAWEIGWFAGRCQLQRAFRRFQRGGAASSLGLRVQYPPARRVVSAFLPEFEFILSRGVGIFVPPSYVDLPRPLVRMAGRFDERLGAFPLLRPLGDHRLYVFRRRQAC